MITGINRLQRPGRSYLHGVLRDAARPYAYRNGARRLLHGEAGCGVRPLYGNHFMPVSFRYLDAPYGFEYGPSDAPGLPAAQSATGFVSTPRAARGDSLAAAAPAPAPATAVPASKTEMSAPLRNPRPPVASGAQAATATDIRVPGDTRQGAPRAERDAAARTVRQAAAAAQTAPSSSGAAPEPVVEPETERPAKSAVQPAVPAAPRVQRLPADLSLGALAKMLERQNFEKPDVTQSRVPGPAEAGPRLEDRAAGAEPVQGKISTPARTGPRAPVREQVISIRPAPAGPARMTARVSARQPELRLPMPRRAVATERARTQPHRETQQQAGTARRPARAAGRKQAQGTRRVNVIRRTAPAAFWERSYLSSLELRMYR